MIKTVGFGSITEKMPEAKLQYIYINGVPLGKGINSKCTKCIKVIAGHVADWLNDNKETINEFYINEDKEIV